ncbi:hypothetical protein [Parafrankia sp. EUN1f]|uniref:hypothetical protein n=1 Tax=Parafrankia sp. EUN1f TaxID=102897 RepID=UPI0001C46452|nr:hypothetical protein [Parafrankia sp. EUN1f]EFC80882.1 hypothetical protein FrEUN1fDRAFT_5984 [Parafrankia sp. EUN1f]
MPLIAPSLPETARLSLPAREPAALLGGAQAVLAAVLPLAAFWVDALTPGLQGAILAVSAALFAIIGAVKVQAAGGERVNPALFYGFFQVVIPLGVLLGLDLPAGFDAVFLAAVATVLGLWTRNEATPRAALRPAG